MKYEVNFDKWIMLMLPTFLRHRGIFSLCQGLCSGIKALHKQFLAAREEHLFRLGHNGQVCYLRAALNEAFKRTGSMTKFEIYDASDSRGEWLYAKRQDMDGQLYAATEGNASHAKPVPILADESRLNAPHNSFIVSIPSSLAGEANLEKVKAIVETYKTLSKQPVYKYHS